MHKQIIALVFTYGLPFGLLMVAYSFLMSRDHRPTRPKSQGRHMNAKGISSRCLESDDF